MFLVKSIRTMSFMHKEYQPSHCWARRSPLPPTAWRILIFSLAYFCCSHSKAFTSSFPVTDFPFFLRVCCSRIEAQSFSMASLCRDVNLATLSWACFTKMSMTVWHLKNTKCRVNIRIQYLSYLNYIMSEKAGFYNNVYAYQKKQNKVPKSSTKFYHGVL